MSAQKNFLKILATINYEFSSKERGVIYYYSRISDLWVKVTEDIPDVLPFRITLYDYKAYTPSISLKEAINPDNTDYPVIFRTGELNWEIGASFPDVSKTFDIVEHGDPPQLYIACDESKVYKIASTSVTYHSSHPSGSNFLQLASFNNQLIGGDQENNIYRYISDSGSWYYIGSLPINNKNEEENKRTIIKKFQKFYTNGGVVEKLFIGTDAEGKIFEVDTNWNITLSYDTPEKTIDSFFTWNSNPSLYTKNDRLYSGWGYIAPLDISIVGKACLYNNISNIQIPFEILLYLLTKIKLGYYEVFRNFVNIQSPQECIFQFFSTIQIPYESVINSLSLFQIPDEYLYGQIVHIKLPSSFYISLTLTQIPDEYLYRQAVYIKLPYHCYLLTTFTEVPFENVRGVYITIQVPDECLLEMVNKILLPHNFIKSVMDLEIPEEVTYATYANILLPYNFMRSVTDLQIPQDYTYVTTSELRVPYEKAYAIYTNILLPYNFMRSVTDLQIPQDYVYVSTSNILLPYSILSFINNIQVPNEHIFNSLISIQIPDEYVYLAINSIQVPDEHTFSILSKIYWPYNTFSILSKIYWPYNAFWSTSNIKHPNSIFRLSINIWLDYENVKTITTCIRQVNEGGFRILSDILLPNSPFILIGGVMRLYTWRK